MGYKLSEKEREAAKLYKNMNYFRLEKENNDKIYTRIFTSSREKVLAGLCRKAAPLGPRETSSLCSSRPTPPTYATCSRSPPKTPDDPSGLST